MERKSKSVLNDSLHNSFGEESHKKSPLKKILAYMATIIAVIYIILFAFGAGLGSYPDSATIISIEGSAFVQREDSSLAIPADEGMKVFSGDLLTTFSESTIGMQFEDGSISHVAPDSRLSLQDLHYSSDGSLFISVNLSSGRLWTIIKDFTERNSRFEVHTPTSVAGVRGTGFSVEVYENNDDESEEKSPLTTYRVYEGSIGVTAAEDITSEDGATKALNAGEQGSASISRIFDIAEPLRVMEVDEWNKDNLVEYLPVNFVEIETEVKVVKLDETAEQIDVYTSDREELVPEMLSYQDALTGDSEEELSSEDINSIINNMEEEIDLINELLDVFDEEIEELEQSKRDLEELLVFITDKESEIADREELNDLVKEDVGDFWQEEKELAERNMERNKRKDELKEEIESLRDERDRIIKGISEEEEAVLRSEIRKPSPFTYNVTTPSQPHRRPPEGSPDNDNDSVSDGYIRITVQPENVTAGNSFHRNPTVRVFDRFGNPVQNTRVTAAKSSGNFASGTLTVNTDNRGFAVFDDLVVTKAGRATLSFSTRGIPSARSAEFNVSPAKADKIEILNMPSSSTAGTSLSPAPEIKITDRYGNPVRTGIRVTANLNKGSFASGLTTKTPNEDGVISFNNLVINKADSNYRITFSAPGLGSSTSGNFNVLASEPDPVKSEASCNSPVNVQAGYCSVEIIAIDKFGNYLTGNHNVTIRYGSENWFNGTVTFNSTGRANVDIHVPDAGRYTDIRVSVNGKIIHRLDFIAE